MTKNDLQLSAVHILCAMVQSCGSYKDVPPPMLLWYRDKRAFDLDDEVTKQSVDMQAVRSIKLDLEVIDLTLKEAR